MTVPEQDSFVSMLKLIAIQLSNRKSDFHDNIVCFYSIISRQHHLSLYGMRVSKLKQGKIFMLFRSHLLCITLFLSSFFNPHPSPPQSRLTVSGGGLKSIFRIHLHELVFNLWKLMFRLTIK